MIVSVSRRTDIPAFYADWFFNRLRAGYADTANPMNPHRISRVPLTPECVDGFVFWTKNPAPMLPRLDELRDYAYYFQFTVTPYADDVETQIPSKQNSIIPTFRALSARIGRTRVVWRYDPILISEKYTVDYHIRYFRRLCDRLADAADTCTLSFLDAYRRLWGRFRTLGIAVPTETQTEYLMGAFSGIAGEYGITLNTCAETADLSRYGIGHAACIDGKRLSRIAGVPIAAARDKNQRPACGCAASVDIGTYNTCQNGCVYCYANYSRALVETRCAAYDPTAEMLCTVPPQDAVIRLRADQTSRIQQMSLFDGESES